VKVKLHQVGEAGERPPRRTLVAFGDGGTQESGEHRNVS
jgi:hypothetical protein